MMAGETVPRTGGRTTQSARVAVIGGGIVGASVLYWLTKLGWTDVVLLERSDLTAGSTWHAAGNVTSFHGLYDLTRVQKASLELYRTLDEETHGAVGMRQIGCLFLARHEGQMDEYRMQSGLSDDEFYVLGAAAAEHYHTRCFESALPAHGVGFAPVTSRTGILALAGPRARDILAAATHEDVSNQALPFFGLREIEIGAARARVLRVAVTGELGYELHVPVEALLPLYETLRRAGASFGLANFGFRAMNCLRLEKSYRRLGFDLTPEITPLEAGMEAFVDLEHSDFVGREALLRQRDSGIRWRLATLEVDAAEADAIGNEPVFAGDRLVGVVTSGGYGHTVGRSLALARIQADLVESGGEFAIEILADRRRAWIVPAPVYDPTGERLRG